MDFVQLFILGMVSLTILGSLIMFSMTIGVLLHNRRVRKQVAKNYEIMKAMQARFKMYS